MFKLFTQAHWSRSQSYTNNGFFKLVELLLQIHKTTYLAAISSYCLAATCANQNAYYRNLSKPLKI